MVKVTAGSRSELGLFIEIIFHVFRKFYRII